MVAWGCVIQKVCSAYSQMCFKSCLPSQLKYSCQFYSSVLVKLDCVWRELLYFALKGIFRQENEIISPSFRVAMKFCMRGCMLVCVCGMCVRQGWRYPDNILKVALCPSIQLFPLSFLSLPFLLSSFCLYFPSFLLLLPVHPFLKWIED